MCGTVMRGADALPGSKATSRCKGIVSEPGRSRVWPERFCCAGPHREGEEPKPMMNGREKSDPAIVAAKPANRAGRPVAELVERRAGTKGNEVQHSTRRAQSRASVSQALDRIRKAARQREKERFTALLHHINTDAAARRRSMSSSAEAAAGVDRCDVEGLRGKSRANTRGLHRRVHRGAYRALPSRRVYIPKPDGHQRPLAVAALEDKIVQRAVVALLSAIYEEDFLGFSYGFRPGAAPMMRWMRSASGSTAKR